MRRPTTVLLAAAGLTALAPAAPAGAATQRDAHHGKRHGAEHHGGKHRSRARSVTFGARTLKRGRRGRDVRTLQRVLTASGVKVRSDGIFGAGTERRVRRYETVYGEPVDGRVDRREAQRMLARLALLRAARGAAPAAQNGGVFPVQGDHRFGDGFGDRGGEHQGEDVLADCGVPVVAAAAGSVQKVGYDRAGGNYAVLHDDASGEDHVYMHLRDRPALEEDAAVAAGAPVGVVGETGNATACHLHFEIWTAPGYYAGGQPRDPLPDLRAWGG